MKKIYILLIICLFGTSSCSDWLDIRPDTEQKDKDQFSTTNGFCDALTGCYMTLASRDIYGERLAYTNIESLANLWYMSEDETTRYPDLDFMRHDYTNNAESAIELIYSTLFNVIAQANMIIKNVDERGEKVILNPQLRAVIQGEAYAIRAYCQLDVLRLFGQLPQGGTLQVELPYSETTSIYEMPPYYSFDEYKSKLENDLNKADSLLKNNDPVFDYTFQELNSTPAALDDFLYYRQSRMNYWAVKALKSRMYLYLGDTDKAYSTAMEIINAKIHNTPVITMSGSEDFEAGYKLCPSECLFYLSKYNIMEYSSETLIGDNTSTVYNQQNHLALTTSMLTELYNGQNINSHNRYLNCWNKQIKDKYNKLMVTLTKYYWDESKVSNPMLYYQIIPMLRMSEIYLIAMECTQQLDEANSLYKIYMLAHNIANVPDFTSLDEVKDFIISEYRREFFGEGQMFYTYKRTNASTMLWHDGTVEENEYILPLPDTEFNPNK